MVPFERIFLSELVTIIAKAPFYCNISPTTFLITS